MGKFSSYERIIIGFSVIMGIFFLVSMMKRVSYPIILADGSTWNALNICKVLGVGAARICTHYDDNFIFTFIHKLPRWAMCSIILGLLWVFRFLFLSISYRKEGVLSEKTE